MQTRTAIWVAIIATLLVCLGLVYTAGLLLIVADLSRDQQAVLPLPLPDDRTALAQFGDSHFVQEMNHGKG